MNDQIFKKYYIFKYFKMLKIRGPSLLYICEYDEKRYYMFGDNHSGIDSKCDKICQDLEKGTFKNINNDSNCVDITRFIDMVCKNQEKIGQWVDFYLELIYNRKIGTKNVNVGEHDINFLRKLRSTFYPCTTRPVSNNCIYYNTRFHYIDIRLSYNPELGQSSIFGLVKSVVNIVKKNILISTNNVIDYYSISRTTYEYSKFVKVFIGHENLDIELLNIYMSSEDYVNDIEKYKNKFWNIYIKELSKDAIYNNTPIISDLFNQTINNFYYTIYNGKILSKLAIQFKSLEYQGDKDISDNIKEYIIDEYINVKKESIDSNIFEKISRLTLKLNRFFSMSYNRDRFGKEYNEDYHNIKSYATKINTISFVETEALLTDAYTLSRMFRTYPNSNHIESSRVIIYAGTGHVKRYKDFFEKYLNVKFRTYGDYGTSRCLDIEFGDLL